MLYVCNMLLLLLLFFFFKQKTAYEMRISDWSSDVCSSDLQPDRDALEVIAHAALVGEATGETAFQEKIGESRDHPADDVYTATPTHRQHIVTGHASQPAAELLEYFQGNGVSEIGRASCRERVCQYV